MKKLALNSTAVALFLCLMGTAFIGAGTNGPRTFDPLSGVRRALSASGAASLTTAQEDQLAALIAARRAALDAQTPSAALEAAELAFQNAILTANLNVAQAQADVIAAEKANLTRIFLRDSAAFQISVLNILNASQVSSLVTRLGTTGVGRLLGSVAGGHGPGPRFGGPGRGPGDR